jgi:hypothetical protein
MRNSDDRITEEAQAGRPSSEAISPAPEESPSANLPISLEDNPFRLRGVGWEGSFADTGLGWIVALACLVAPVALVLGLLGGLLLRGPRARRKAWIMAAVAALVTAIWAVVLIG